MKMSQFGARKWFVKICFSFHAAPPLVLLPSILKTQNPQTHHWYENQKAFDHSALQKSIFKDHFAFHHADVI